MKEKLTNLDIAKYILVALIIISLGLFSINQLISYRYKVEFIKTPCDLCRKLNPHLENCFVDYSIKRIPANISIINITNLEKNLVK
jgi:hypothetical protein